MECRNSSSLSERLWVRAYRPDTLFFERVSTTHCWVSNANVLSACGVENVSNSAPKCILILQGGHTTATSSLLVLMLASEVLWCISYAVLWLVERVKLIFDIKIDVLNLENNNVSELFASNFESCNMIKKIILSGNPIRTFDPLIFKNMKRLGNIQIDAGNEDAEESDDTICWSTKGKWSLPVFLRILLRVKWTKIDLIERFTGIHANEQEA